MENKDNTGLTGYLLIIIINIITAIVTIWATNITFDFSNPTVINGLFFAYMPYRLIYAGVFGTLVYFISLGIRSKINKALSETKQIRLSTGGWIFAGVLAFFELIIATIYATPTSFLYVIS